MDKKNPEWQALNRIWKQLTPEQRKMMEDDFKVVASSNNFIEPHNEGEIIVPNYSGSFIYFLLRDNRVVYVGKTSIGLRRPFEHYDKRFDFVKLIPFDSSLLDRMEEKYIEEYKPEYNLRANEKFAFSELEMKRALSNLYYPDKPLSYPKLRYITQLAHISPININGRYNYSHDMYEKLCEFIDSFSDQGGPRAIFANYTYEKGKELMDVQKELEQIIESACLQTQNREEFIEFLSRYHIAVTKEHSHSLSLIYRNSMYSTTKLNPMYSKEYLYKLN